MTEPELLAFFKDDADAQRRYRLLYTLLIDGMTQREAAGAHSVSERTVRNVLRAYADGGLDALRSRRGAGQRPTTPAEQAIADALAAEPNAGGDRLWRLAQESLGQDGASLSRRTAYRILARLRAEDTEGEDEGDEDEAPSSLRARVRAALPLLAEDPPLALGASPLALQLIGDEDDTLVRGLLLQQAIREALDHLRPPGAVSTIDRSWWPYLICTGEYEAGQRRAELQEDLALSASTYSRAKRQGLDTLTGLLPQILAGRVERPAAMAGQRLPRTPDFVGRREEESYYAWRLQTEGAAHIWGLPGSGKTALAAELAAEGLRYGQTTLWHTCHAGPEATLAGILRGLAKVLWAGGDDTLWRQLRRIDSDTPDTHELLDLLRERLVQRPAVVVLDDFHRVDEREAELLFDALAELVARKSTRLLLVGRWRLDSLAFPPLQGLSERDARLLWAGAPVLSAEQWWALYEATGGLPELLRLVATASRRAGELFRPGDWSKEIAAWAREEIWNRLTLDEQRLLAAAHALPRFQWAEHSAQICDALQVDQATVAQVRRRALLVSSQATAALLDALRGEFETLLRRDATLHDCVAALATSQNQGELAPEELGLSAIEPAPPHAPAGIELLERVREALQNSAAYLQRRSSDRVARQLAAELEILQGALPDPAGPRTPGSTREREHNN
jgi:transposase